MPRTRTRRRSAFLPIIGIILLAAAAGLLWRDVHTRIEKMSHPLRYTDYVERYAAEFDVPREVIYAVIKVESSFNAEARSRVGAVGLMQLLPDTYEWVAWRLGEDPGADAIVSPEVNIRYGTYYLAWLYGRLGSWDNTYAAYNAGLGRVQQWMASSGAGADGILTDIPIPETAAYVERVSEAAKTYRRLYDL